MRGLLSVDNMENHDIMLLRRVMENAKQHFADPQKLRTIGRMKFTVWQSKVSIHCLQGCSLYMPLFCPSLCVWIKAMATPTATSSLRSTTVPLASGASVRKTTCSRNPGPVVVSAVVQTQVSRCRIQVLRW